MHYLRSAVQLLIWAVGSNSYFFREEMEAQFQMSFHERCDKYAFVQKWVQLLDNPPEKVIMSLDFILLLRTIIIAHGLTSPASDICVPRKRIAEWWPR
jgi:hypothetical protein